MSYEEVRRVLEEHREEWMALPAVTGTGIGSCEGTPCITIYVERRTPQLERRFADPVDGAPVRLEVTGRFRTGEPPSG